MSATASLRAQSAAIWLTPTRDGGENIFDVAIYLSGQVMVQEGTRSNSTVTSGRELLVTTRISRAAQLVGTPVSQVEERNPIVTRQ